MPREKRKSNQFRSLVQKVSRDCRYDDPLFNYVTSKKISDRVVQIGKYTVTKTPEKTYTIKPLKGDTALYSNVYCLEAALAIVECLNNGKVRKLRKIECEEQRYAKHYNDMVNYERLLNSATNNFYLYESRYEVAKSKLEDSHHKIIKIRNSRF